MLKLNLPTYPFKFMNENGQISIYDTVRKKFVALTPEEWVRQHFIQYLIQQKGYPPSLMHIEKTLSYNQLQKRCDLVIYNKKGLPVIIIEFKSPQISITQEVFNQIAIYNAELKVNFLIVSNGLTHYCCKMNSELLSFEFIEKIPLFKELDIV